MAFNTLFHPTLCNNTNTTLWHQPRLIDSFRTKLDWERIRWHSSGFHTLISILFRQTLIDKILLRKVTTNSLELSNIVLLGKLPWTEFLNRRSSSWKYRSARVQNGSNLGSIGPPTRSRTRRQNPHLLTSTWSTKKTLRNISSTRRYNSQITIEKQSQSKILGIS